MGLSSLKFYSNKLVQISPRLRVVDLGHLLPAYRLNGYQTMHRRTGKAQVRLSTVEPRYLELAYFKLPLISKWKSGPYFNMKLWQQVTK